eukprot:CAMPEP_0184024340 /NCGR_PEP_ID=MMETSP0954-20121128/12015_1 /TAXON_ID=627963 /ORGANISM="Aplanochytrium sp, Strain PBS07" /LENGTH=100 /DNA_ID=CAMNT_0026307631 /DNA_START=253 /DNA_END=552 /DNA_ORIENTATION=+
MKEAGQRLKQLLESVSAVQERVSTDPDLDCESLKQLLRGTLKSTSDVNDRNGNERKLLATLLLRVVPTHYLPLLNQVEKETLYESFFKVPEYLLYSDFLQ